MEFIAHEAPDPDQECLGTSTTRQTGSFSIEESKGFRGAGSDALEPLDTGDEVLEGSVTLDGVDVLALEPWERAAVGLHLVMQYPIEVPGVMLDDVMAGIMAAVVLMLASAAT